MTRNETIDFLTKHSFSALSTDDQYDIYCRSSYFKSAPYSPESTFLLKVLVPKTEDKMQHLRAELDVGALEYTSASTADPKAALDQVLNDFMTAHNSIGEILETEFKNIKE